MITINDVAKKCGVAKSTVSNALTGKKYVSPELTQKIRAACKELDFQPNFYASTLSRGETNIIALVLEEDSTVKFRGFYADLIVSCLRTAAARGRHLLVYSGLDRSSVVTMLKRDKAPIDGAIVMTPLVDDARILQLEKQRIPCVIIGRPAEDLHISYVDINNIKMVGDVADRLYAQGCRRFCLINSESSKTISIDRARGFSHVLCRKGDAETHVVYSAESSEAEGRRCAGPYMEKGMAFIVSDGTVAKGVYDLARESGEDIFRSVRIYSLGQDDSAHIPWEYARQDYAQLGKLATETLLNEIEGDREPKHICTEDYIL